MSRALLSTLKSAGVPAVLLAVGLAVACLPREGIDPGPLEAAARRPAPRCPVDSLDFRFPAPDQYPLAGKPWIRSREDLIAYFTRGEDPEMVRRYVVGPEEELIDYLGEVFSRSGYPDPGGTPRAVAGDQEGDLAMGMAAGARR